MTDSSEGQCCIAARLLHHDLITSRMVLDERGDVVDFVLDDDPAVAVFGVPRYLFQRVLG